MDKNLSIPAPTNSLLSINIGIYIIYTVLQQVWIVVIFRDALTFISKLIVIYAENIYKRVNTAHSYWMVGE